MKRTRQGASAALFLAPNLFGFLVFTAVPLAVSLVMAFTNWDLRRRVPLEFVGLRNFADLLTASEFWLYLINTLYLMLAIPVGIAGSLGLAMLIHGRTGGRSAVGRFAHAGLALGCGVVIGGGLLATGSGAARVAAGLLLLASCVYALGALTGVVAFRTLYYLPSFTSGVALYILWKGLYNPHTGPINASLRWLLDGSWGGLNETIGWLGLGPLRPPDWLQSVHNLLALSPEHPGVTPSLFGVGAREALMLMGFVTGVGGNNMLLYLAGLSNVPQELYEAADIDGASRWQKFRAVTWPQLAPTTFFIFVMSCIGGLQGGFDVARVMTDGGPAGTTTTLSYYIYNKAFNEFRFGYASAVAWVLFAMVFALTLITWWFGSRRTDE
jgi:multiple sugar transport system permease protein